MEVKNLLEFLNKTKNLHTFDYAVCASELPNFLDLIDIEEDFTNKIDIGVVYLSEESIDKSILIDGLGRILSVSLLLHAVCECYKKTTEKNENAIKTIRKKYLVNNTKTKLRLPASIQEIYRKIIFGEKLSGKEKAHPMFVLLHNYWQDIKEKELKAVNIFGMLQKFVITAVSVENVNNRDLYYSLNKDSKKLNQILLIEDFLNTPKTREVWKDIKELYQNKNSDLILFLRDFFWSKFNYKKFDENKLYEYFVNYFETMLKYSKSSDIINKIKRSARLYLQLLNVDMPNEELKNAIIQLKLHNCDDTYPYLLGVYEDYNDGSLSLETFLEILAAVEEYLENREKNHTDIGFNELITYLNAYIAYK